MPAPNDSASPNDAGSPSEPSTRPSETRLLETALPETPYRALYDAAFAESPERLAAYADFAAIVKHLRRDCPWDREQTHTSVKHLLIEEAYEVVDAIEARDWDELKRELGDVFLHVLFHSRIAEEAGRFTLQDVIEAETEKLVRRHPHVFGPDAHDSDKPSSAQGDAANRSQGNAPEESDSGHDDAKKGANEAMSSGAMSREADSEMSSEAVLANWERIKQQERAEKASDGDSASVLDGVPSHLPSLLRALRVQQKAAGVGFDFPDQVQTWAKVEEEIREFKAAVEAHATASANAPGAPNASDASGSPASGSDGHGANAATDAATDAEATDDREDELGDVLFALVNYARRAGLNPENALRRTTRRFTSRFQHIERRLAEDGRTVADVDLATADALWEEAKAEETT